MIFGPKRCLISQRRSLPHEPLAGVKRPIRVKTHRAFFCLSLVVAEEGENEYFGLKDGKDIDRLGHLLLQKKEKMSTVPRTNRACWTPGAHPGYPRLI